MEIKLYIIGTQIFLMYYLLKWEIREVKEMIKELKEHMMNLKTIEK